MKNIYLPIICIFIVVNGVAVVFSKALTAKGVDLNLVIGGNILIAFATFLGIFISGRGLASKNPQAVVRAMMGGLMAKFFILLISVAIYAMSVNVINRAGLFICLGLYLVYHFMGTIAMMQQKKQLKDGQGKSSV